MQLSIEGLKAKLAFHCGTQPSAMRLQLKDAKGSMLACMDDDSKKLGYYSPENGFVLHIIDVDPTSASANGWLEDVSKVQKYVMSDADYEQRDNTYRKYKQGKLAEDATWTLEREMAARRGGGASAAPAREKVTDPEHMADLAAGVHVGDRCLVSPGEKRGLVRFVGKAAGLPMGYWVGVQLDEPVGKNDGCVKGKRYFECPEGFGTFVRPDSVVVGDYPEVDLLGSDDEF